MSDPARDDVVRATNYELGLEVRARRWIFKGAAGWAVAGNSEALVCTKSAEGCNGATMTWLHPPYLAASVGRTWR